VLRIVFDRRIRQPQRKSVKSAGKMFAGAELAISTCERGTNGDVPRANCEILEYIREAELAGHR